MEPLRCFLLGLLSSQGLVELIRVLLFLVHAIHGVNLRDVSDLLVDLLLGHLLLVLLKLSCFNILQLRSHRPEQSQDPLLCALKGLVSLVGLLDLFQEVEGCFSFVSDVLLLLELFKELFGLSDCI